MSMNQLSLVWPQSVTDYPLRNQTVLAMAGFALLLLARTATETRSERA